MRARAFAGWGRGLSVLVAGWLVLVAACGPSAAPAPTKPAAPAAPAGGAPPAGGASADQQWSQVVEAAKREGEITVYGPPGAQYRDPLVRAFESANPGIKVNFTAGAGSDLGPKMIAERQAGRFIPDLFVGGTTTMNDVLKPAGAIDPIPPLLVRPDVTDPAKWFEGQLWWADDEQQYNLMFEGSASQIIAVNKTLVNPESITSYWDVLDPRYRGQIVASDIRRPGPGGGQSRFIWVTEGLGPPFLEKLFGEMDVTLAEDRRQLADWLAQGRFAISIFPGTNEIDAAIKQGLPLAYADNRKLREGFPLSAGWGSVVVMNQRPHPNATLVYLNWLLSPEGQAAWQKATGGNSLRADIPKDGVDPLAVPPPGSKIFFASLERYANLELEPIRKLITDALEKRR